ncbi:unnamed protein product, partial [Mesorhabditis spiculigera]
MSLNQNPFSDPFADPSVRAAATSGASTNINEDFNPFAQRAQPPQPSAAPQASAGASVHGDEIFRRQEELERKAQELRKKEEEMERRQREGAQRGNGATGPAPANGARPHNWPPLPTIIPIEPCFYQDIEVEIPVQFQKTVTLVYYVFLIYVLALFVNVVTSLFYVLFAKGTIGTLFLAIIQLVLFSPCAFLFWFRPVYKAFRNDSSFNFMIFFFVLFFHSIFTLVQTLGISQYACGWVIALETFSVSVPVALLMCVCAAAFTVALGGMVFSLLKVHRLYRGAGFSIDKARQEFTNGVMSDRNVQAAAGAAARGAAGAAFQQASQGRF